MNLDPYLIPYTKINSKPIKDLNLKDKTIKLLRKKKITKLTVDGLVGGAFMSLSPKSGRLLKTIYIYFFF